MDKTAAINKIIWILWLLYVDKLLDSIQLHEYSGIIRSKAWFVRQPTETSAARATESSKKQVWIFFDLYVNQQEHPLPELQNSARNKCGFSLICTSTNGNIHCQSHRIKQGTSEDSLWFVLQPTGTSTARATGFSKEQVWIFFDLYVNQQEHPMPELQNSARNKCGFSLICTSTNRNIHCQSYRIQQETSVDFLWFVRQPTGTSTARARGFSKEQVRIFFDFYERALTAYEYPLLRIFNVDGTGLSVVQKKLPRPSHSKANCSRTKVL
jgi:hypothetical protein